MGEGGGDCRIVINIIRVDITFDWSKARITGGVPQTKLNGVRVRCWSDLMH